jgi:ABC-type xylose transport system permease subunit
MASEIGIDAERIRGVLAAIAPIVGTARIASATGKIVEVLEVAIEIAELEEEGQETT